MKLTLENEQYLLDFGNGCIAVADTRGGLYRGIREVTLHSRPLRSPRETIWPEIATPDGREVAEYRFLEARAEQDHVVLLARPIWRTAHRMEWREHGGHARIPTTSWSTGTWSREDHVLKVTLRPETRDLGGRTYNGFSYGYSWDAPGHAIYQIEDKASWELGGQAKGNTWIMRNAFAPPVLTLGGEGFDSGWTLPGIANPHVFQHLPLVTQLSGFTFQQDAELALVTVPARPSHVRSLYHQDPGGDLLLHFNQFVFDLAEKAELPAMCILAAPAETDIHERNNHYLAVRDELQSGIRRHYGVLHTAARPTGLIEDWDVTGLEPFPDILEWMHTQGMRQIFIQGLWRSNETDLVMPLGGRDPVLKKRWGTLGNMCCIIEPDIADCFGGWPALEAALEPARRLGLECFTWYSNCFSSMSPFTKRDPGFFARDPDGQFSRNNYGHVLFATNNNSPVHFEVFKTTMKHLHDIGFRGVFRDSHFNMGSDTIDWRAGGDPPWGGNLTPDKIGTRGEQAASSFQPRIRSMHDAEIAQQRFCQHELGFTYFVESAGVMGTPKCGTRLQFTHGNEWIFDDMHTLHEDANFTSAGLDPQLVYFRSMANRLFLAPLARPNLWAAEGLFEKWYCPTVMSAMNHAYLKAEPFLGKRRILPDDQGVLWSSPQGVDVLFSFADATHALGKNRKVETLYGSSAPSSQTDSLHAKSMHLYLIHPA